MKQLKKVLATAGSGLVLALSMAGAASADAVNNCQSGFELIGGACVAIDNSDHVNVDRSRAYTVNGDCSGIIFSDVDQSQNNSTGQSAGSTGGAAGFGDASNNSTNTNSNSTSQSQSAGVTFSPNCSTTNNTTVAAAPAAAQVKAPTGGVHAGGGAAVSAASSTASIGGLLASVSTLGLGFAGRKTLMGL